MSRFILFAVMLLAIQSARAAEGLADSARALAQKIAAALTAGERIELSVRNASSLGAREAAQVREALEGELRPRLGGGEAAAAVGVTLSENAAGFMWVAEIRRADRRDVAMLARSRAPAASDAPGALLVLDKRPLWEQEAPILDVAVLEDLLVVLDSAGVSLFRREGEQWTRQKSLPVSSSTLWPRDLRGRLEIRGDALGVLLPGLVCAGSVRPEPRLECTEGQTELATGRNYFTAPGLPPYYSAASAGDIRILAGVDGSARILDETQKPVASVPGWGSEIAAIETKCGTQVLASRPGDPDEPDAVQAFQIQDRQPVASSAAVEFLGPLTALWQGVDKSTAVAIARNLRTGRYAAFSLSVTCGR